MRNRHSHFLDDVRPAHDLSTSFKARDDFAARLLRFGGSQLNLANSHLTPFRVVEEKGLEGWP